MSHLLIYITAADDREAELIGRTLVQERLAACVNIIPGMRSLYWWDGQVQEGREVVVLAKTRTELFADLKSRVAELHSYDCPCIVALPLTDGHQPFLDWISAETASHPSPIRPKAS